MQSIDQDSLKVQPIQVGSRIFCEGQHSCFEIGERLNSKGIKIKIENKEAGLWSIFIESATCGDNEIAVMIK